MSPHLQEGGFCPDSGSMTVDIHLSFLGRTSLIWEPCTCIPCWRELREINLCPRPDTAGILDPRNSVRGLPSRNSEFQIKFRVNPAYRGGGGGGGRGGGSASHGALSRETDAALRGHRRRDAVLHAEPLHEVLSLEFLRSAKTMNDGLSG